MGGGGDDFSAQAAQAEAKKQTARDALNLQFGVAPTGGVAPTRDQFTTYTDGPMISTPTGSGELSGETLAPQHIPNFDQAGFDAATTAFNNRGADADKNKAAREALYSQVRNDAFTAGTRGLDEKKDSAGRDLRFALFGQGLNGGSEDINQNALLDRTYNQGKLDLGAKADAAEAGLRGSDESTRLGLLQSIDSGLDQGSALSSSLNQLQVNSDKAAADAQGTSLGDLFGDAGLLYTKSKAGQGVADTRSQFGSLFPSATAGYGVRSGKGYFGTQSATGG